MTGSKGAESFIDDLRDAAAKNPLSAALIGMGALWLVSGARSPRSVGDILRNAVKSVPGAMGSAEEKPSDEISAVTGATSALVPASGKQPAMPDTGAQLEKVSDNLAQLFRAQPLVLGVLGVAVGAGMAAALPRSDMEASYLGEASVSIKSKVSDIAGEQATKAAVLVSDVFDVASGEARKQGLTVDGAKAAVEDIKGKVGRITKSVQRPAET